VRRAAISSGELALRGVETVHADEAVDVPETAEQESRTSGSPGRPCSRRADIGAVQQAWLRVRWWRDPGSVAAGSQHRHLQTAASAFIVWPGKGADLRFQDRVSSPLAGPHLLSQVSRCDVLPGPLPAMIARSNATQHQSLLWV